MRTAIGLFALALGVRVLLLLLYPDPAYVDSYYYVNVARALSAGHGFSIDFIWTFVDVGGHLPADPVLPIAEQRPLDAPGQPGPGPVHRRPGGDRLRLGACPLP
jgi:hypothetical protein